MEELLIRGKTKALYQTEEANLVRVQTLDRLSDGKLLHDCTGIAAEKTKQNAILNRYLQRHGVKTAFVEQTDDAEMLYQKTKMLGVEFVVRQYPAGSYYLRNPQVAPTEQPQPFDDLVFEMFYKRSVLPQANGSLALASQSYVRRQQVQHSYAEPYIKVEQSTGLWDLYDQKQPVVAQNRLLAIRPKLTQREIAQIKEQCFNIFHLLSDALAQIQCQGNSLTLADLKLEFGRLPNGEIILSDVIDADSWRVWLNGNARENLNRDYGFGAAGVDSTLAKYRQVTNLLSQLDKLKHSTINKQPEQSLER